MKCRTEEKPFDLCEFSKSLLLADASALAIQEMRMIRGQGMSHEGLSVCSVAVWLMVELKVERK